MQPSYSQGTKPIRLLVVDPRPDMVQHITKLLDNEPDILVVGSATDAEEAFARMAELHPDVVLMEITLPGRFDGLQAALVITQRWQTCVILMSEHPEVEYLLQAMTIGARGFLTKPFTGDELADTVRSASSRWLLYSVQESDHLGRR
jgi:DNA-binding NarL/FixJ family response regulator